MRGGVLALTAFLWALASAIWCLVYVRQHALLGQPGTYETRSDFQVIAFVYEYGAQLILALIAALVIEGIALFRVRSRRALTAIIGAVLIACGVGACKGSLEILAHYTEYCASERHSVCSLERYLFPFGVGLIICGGLAIVVSLAMRSRLGRPESSE
jgi:hypothetical protein